MKSSAEWHLDLMKINQIMRENKDNPDKIIYLFLDFDGVINVFYLEGTPEYEEMLKREPFDFASKECVQRLNNLCRDYPIRLVLSSSWRYSGIEYCTKYLRDAGMDENITFAGMTDPETFKPRPEHIAEYLLQHPDFAGFLIMDDMKMPILHNYLVMTHPLKGWDEESDQKARKILEKFM